MRVLLIGGTGIISTDITLLAAQRDDIDLYILNRGNLPQFIPEGVTLIQADINDADTVREKTRGMTFDVVADFLSYGVGALKQKLDLFRGRCGQYIFISSCAAYRPPLDFTIQTEANSPTGNPLWQYGLDKTLCERRLAEEYAESGMPYTIVRPAYTYNNIRILQPYTINHWRSWTVAQRLLDGKPYVLHDDGQQLCTATHSTDFAKAFIGLWGNPAAMNEDFHITSSDYVTWQRIAELTAEILGVTPTFCYVSAQDLFIELSRSAGEKIMATTQHAVYDSAKVRKAVPEFICTTPFAQGLRRTLQFYLDNPEYQKVDETWDSDFDRIVETYGS
ncbi:MAG: NAD-dependent epimerase/dehydratase family protein [Lentisphaerae bacterium]|jgi:nucleoside-diphosphate-sugar epimerase|nr:NAD-dependent epimerase/dehydratase family protein [Lentisphaerota bacterium]MBT4822573.1 NAD-dependent epimerase/dehydratase family protein [Lentisphaerota bacterium]MBT5607767.1 NAD-dependent epimerase/dehydratase family protein [Lentisphaerota bacterium]MBT7053941.1 NAD-dependent epimerase/dehydratase family protein [Lentisphaerota bacterium]MBT7844309.1 NAD-dependent epimerase/dehydratase family protein [Lentisphaerota bacterium]